MSTSREPSLIKTKRNSSSRKNSSSGGKNNHNIEHKPTVLKSEGYKSRDPSVGEEMKIPGEDSIDKPHIFYAQSAFYPSELRDSKLNKANTEKQKLDPRTQAHDQVLNELRAEHQYTLDQELLENRASSRFKSKILTSICNNHMLQSDQQMFIPKDKTLLKPKHTTEEFIALGGNNVRSEKKSNTCPELEEFLCFFGKLWWFGAKFGGFGVHFANLLRKMGLRKLKTSSFRIYKIAGKIFEWKTNFAQLPETPKTTFWPFLINSKFSFFWSFWNNFKS